jgi:hypothetical protein
MYLIAEFLKNSFMRQCNLYCTKGQYDYSNDVLSAWIESPENKDIIGDELRHALEMFQHSLMGKEEFLAQHIRKTITMCADAMTTSPVESMNDLIKRKQKVNSNYNMSKSIEKIVTSNRLRYEENVNGSFMQLNQTVLSSKSLIKTSRGGGLSSPPTKGAALPSLRLEAGIFTFLIKSGEPSGWIISSHVLAKRDI